MIKMQNSDNCLNKNCRNKLLNGANIGGIRAIKQQNGDYITGYICKVCGNQSNPATTQLYLYQKMHYYGTRTAYETEQEEKQEHDRQWRKLLKALYSEEQEAECKLDRARMPKWEDIQPKRGKK